MPLRMRQILGRGAVPGVIHMSIFVGAVIVAL